MSSLVELVRWLVAVAAGLLVALCVLGNWLGVVGLPVNRYRPGLATTFVLPFLGPVFGVIFLVAGRVGRGCRALLLGGPHR